MTITAIRITVPYPPPAELTEDIYEDAEAVWGAEAEIELDAEPTDRGLGAVDPVVLVVVTYLGGRLLDLTTEAAFKSVGERFRRLLTRLRHGDGAGGELGYEIRVEGVGPSGRSSISMPRRRPTRSEPSRRWSGLTCRVFRPTPI